MARWPSEVVRALKRALEEARVDLPYPTTTLTFNEPLEARLPRGRDHGEAA